MALRAVVVGGGIGGIAAAVALARAGIDVQVHEQAQQLTEVGAGVSLAPCGQGTGAPVSARTPAAPRPSSPTGPPPRATW